LLASGTDAADILTKIKTVDGTGSGLDADLLDGQQGTYYAPIASPALTGTPTTPTPTPGDNTTKCATTAFVGAAIVAAISGLATSKSANGYQVLPGELIVQWGVESIAPGANTLTFPLAFPNACFSVVATPIAAATGFVLTTTYTTTNCSMRAATANGAAHWVAVGY
jgi:hypothetical protein